MRKPTRSEAIFLTITLIFATLATVEITPKIMESYKVNMIAKKSKKDTQDTTFNNGLIIGLFGGVLGTKLVMDKLC